MEQDVQLQSGAAAEPASAAAAQDGDAQAAPGGQHASPASDAAAEAGAECLVSIAAAPGDELGRASSGSGMSGARKKTKAMKHHNPLKEVGRKAPPEKSNLGPKVRPTGKARKSTQVSATQPAAAEGLSEEAPQQPVAPEEELQGASEEDIARVNCEYNLTTPHEVGTQGRLLDCSAGMFASSSACISTTPLGMQYGSSMPVDASKLAQD